MSKREKDTGNGWDLINWDVWKNPPKWIAAFVYSIGFLFLFFSAVVLVYVGDRILDTFVNYNIPKEVSYARVLRDLLLSVAAIIGLPFLIWRAILADRQTRTAERQVKLTEEKQDAENDNNLALRLAKARQDLGATRIKDGESAPAMELRLGAIDELEQIAFVSSKQHWPIMERLTAYIRENSPYKKGDEPERITTDIQAAINVIGRRNKEWIKDEINFWQRLNLSNCNLHSVHFGRNTDYTNVNFRYSCFNDANFYHSNIKGAVFDNASFMRTTNNSFTIFEGCDLREASFLSIKTDGICFFYCNCAQFKFVSLVAMNNKCQIYFSNSILLNNLLNEKNSENYKIEYSLLDSGSLNVFKYSNENHLIDFDALSFDHSNKIFEVVKNSAPNNIDWATLIEEAKKQS